METKAVATETALIVVSSVANRYLKKTSIAGRTYLYGDDGNGPRMSICISFPGNDFFVEILAVVVKVVRVVLASFGGMWNNF